MLRVSAMTTKTEIDIQGINGEAANTGIEFGAELIAFAEAIAHRDVDAIKNSRNVLAAVAGGHVVTDVAGVAANFQRMVRIADSIGIPVDDMTTEIGTGVRRDLDLTRFSSAQNTLNRQT